ncbi:hypothetical protein FQA39_LY00895 [Lamprigera yunnana]|nr:hypothetical protein FQA39_LY00895 [Lamprigera yunnana]
MSHSAPDQGIGYNPSNVNYSYREPERYIANYSDSDPISERSHEEAAFNEIYRQKACMPPAECYRRKVYLPRNYYYTTLPSTIPTPAPRNVIYRRPWPMVEDRGRYFPSIVDGTFREHEALGTTARRQLPMQPPIKTRVGRRHAVAVRTPRYFRRATTKPSTLCLPLSCQPDPVQYRRSRKHREDLCYPHQTLRKHMGKDLGRRYSDPLQMSMAENPHKAIHMSQSDIKAVLARYDTVFNSNDLESLSEKCESVSSKASSKIKLMPRVPCSVAAKSSNNNSHKTAVDNLPGLEFTTEALDSMLLEMTNGENKLNGENVKEEKPQYNSAGVYRTKSQEIDQIPGSSNNQESANQYYKSYNYKDISNNISKSQTHNHSDQINFPESPRLESQSVTVKNKLPGRTKSSTCNTQLTDENAVMELHKSKSYIVNLIDRALSRELGTVPDNFYQDVRKEIYQFDTNHAACAIKKSDKRCENGLCMETFPDPPIMNPSCHNLEHRKPCSCNVQNEPLYIKQLRQLRWGHLKHIQMEVRRLEDLERFLDSCTS